MMNYIDKVWNLRRDIISDGYNQALHELSLQIPLIIHSFESGKQCWTWTVPEKWNLKKAGIYDTHGKLIFDAMENVLNVVSYSLPINQIISRDDLLKHIYTSPNRPDAIPYKFKYYERDWGFCMKQNQLSLLSASEYHVIIDSEFIEDFLKVGECIIPGKSEDSIVFCAHLCHPGQVNDGLSGVAAMINLFRTLSETDHFHTYRFYVVPETIGSIAFLSQNEHLIKHMKYGIFLEMLGNESPFALQLSRQGNTLIDKVAKSVLREMGDYRCGAFRKVVGNDEMVFNGPGVDIPMISISRSPYPEYHTSDDTPAIISESKMNEAVELITRITKILDQNYYPKRTFKGPIFLSGFGLWVDPKINLKLNKALEQIMLYLEGDKSIFEIAEETNIEFIQIKEYTDKFFKNGLITTSKVKDS